MDCTVSTGAAAMMAVRVLLVSRPGWAAGRFPRCLDLSCPHVAQDHDVPEDKIFLLSLLMAEMGVHSVAYAFPRVRIITTAVDKRVNDLFRIIPGIGESIVAQRAWLMTQGNPVTQCHFFCRELW